MLFVICLIPLTVILRKANAGYEFSIIKEKINHLLFMDDLKLFSKSEKSLDSLVQTVRIFSSDIGMEFGIEKCASLFIKRGKMVEKKGIELPDGKVLEALKEGDGYKYLGILEAEQVLHGKMKENVQSEYFRRVRKILESKLNGGNLVKGINTWAVSLIRYSASFLDWRTDDMKMMDRKTRKLMTMHKALHPRSNVDRVYLPRNRGGRGLMNIEDIILLEKAGLIDYVKSSNESLLVAARSVTAFENLDRRDTIKKRLIDNRIEQVRQKQLHGQYLRQTEEVSSNEWEWLKDGSLKRETESLIFAAQEQAIRTNYIKCKIDKTQELSTCRMCGSSGETIHHILNDCPKLKQKEYKRRHDWIGKRIHWEIAKKCGFQTTTKSYEHSPETVLENDSFKILWDFNIQTDHILEARRPDLVVVRKAERLTQIVDFAIPLDPLVVEREQQKIEKYQDLAREIKKMWNTKVAVIPIVVGSLGSISKRFEMWTDKLGIKINIKDVQKTALLHSARILRKVLEM